MSKLWVLPFGSTPSLEQIRTMSSFLQVKPWFIEPSLVHHWKTSGAWLEATPCGKPPAGCEVMVGCDVNWVAGEGRSLMCWFLASSTGSVLNVMFPLKSQLWKAQHVNLILSSGYQRWHFNHNRCLKVFLIRDVRHVSLCYNDLKEVSNVGAFHDF